MPDHPDGKPTSMGVAGELLACLAVLAFISAVWLETDLYRYVALAALVPITIHYFRVDFLSKEKVLIGWIGFACIGWGLHVIARLVYNYFFYRSLGLGSSEGIYIYPLLYPISGYALFLLVRRPFIIVASFLLISFVVTSYAFDLRAITGGYRADTILQSNPIHAAVGQGMVVLCMLPLATYVLRARDMRPDLRVGFTTVSIATLFVGLFNIYALESKGVWLALAVSLPFQLLLIAMMHSARREFAVVTGLSSALAVIIVVAAWDGILAVAGDTAQATAELLSDISDAGMLQGMDHAIRDETMPGSFRERLMLWASAVMIWLKDPIFGQGVTWLHEWESRAYPAADYNLLHNGYLEIAIRYGIVGLIFYAGLFSWAITQVWRAKREGIIDPAAFEAYVSVFLFFCLTILSNSNIRLALGESYIWISAAFGFYCYYRLQKRSAIKVETWM